MTPEERERKEQEIRNLMSELSSDVSPIGDWKNLKQLDTGEYSEAEMDEYRAARADVRERINAIQRELDEE